MELSEVVVRPMHEADVVPAQVMTYEAMRRAGNDFGWKMPEASDETRARGQARSRHAIAHDPENSLVAERDGALVGVALAERRGPLWFLALLAVATSAQAQGIGRRLLDGVLVTLDEAGLICASDDPKALRRYHSAGFDLLPCFEAKGPIDRSLIPATPSVRDGSYEDDRELVESIATAQRGAPYGVDLGYAEQRRQRLFVAETAAGRGYLLTAKAGVAALGATHPSVAADLLWTALAVVSEPEVEVAWLTAGQQWAIEVALAARLRLRPSGSLCVRGPVGPMSPYLPCGAYG